MKSPAKTNGVFPKLGQLGNNLAIALLLKEQILKANVGIQPGDDERRGLDRRFALPLEMDARD